MPTCRAHGRAFPCRVRVLRAFGESRKKCFVDVHFRWACLHLINARLPLRWACPPRIEASPRNTSLNVPTYAGASSHDLGVAEELFFRRSFDLCVSSQRMGAFSFAEGLSVREVRGNDFSETAVRTERLSRILADRDASMARKESAAEPSPMSEQSHDRALPRVETRRVSSNVHGSATATARARSILLKLDDAVEPRYEHVRRG